MRSLLGPLLVAALVSPAWGGPRVAGDLVVPTRPPVPTPQRAAGAPAVLYLNFSDGTETLTQGEPDDAPRNVASIGAASPYPEFIWPSLSDGSTTRRALIRQVARRVHELFLPYNVLVTTTRPATGPYTMVIIGGSPTALGFESRVAGLAYMDCGDQQPNNVVFAFPAPLRGSFHGLTVTIAQEAAHAFGLEHTDDPRDIMYPKVDPAQAGFPDRETPVNGERLCGNAVQNSHRKLLQALGPWLGDDKPLDDGSRTDRTPPVVAFLEPAPGPGAALTQPIVVRAEARDETELDRVVLAAGPDRVTLHGGPFGWSVAGQPPGPLRLTLTAYDAAGNTTTAMLDVIVAGDDRGGGCALGGRTRRNARPAVFLLAVAVAACGRRRRRL